MRGCSWLIKIGMVLLSLALSLGLTGWGGAQEKYPAREITFITGEQAGSGNEVVKRALCTGASKILGQNIVVMNKPGASQGLALVAVKNAKPDGYTIGAIPSGAVGNQLMKKVSYDCLKDYTYIMQPTGLSHGMAVRTGAPWKTIQELMAYAKDNPGKVRMGVRGIGSAHHLAMERLSMKIGVKFIMTPFAGEVDALTNLLGGHVDAIFTNLTFLPNVEAGQVRLIAIAGAGESRENWMAEFPNTPTLMELYGIDVPTFTGLGGPKGLPPHVVDTLHKAFKKAMEDPGFIETAKKFSSPIVYLGPEDLTKEVHRTFYIIADIVKKLGLQSKE
jgi:tripartite-type tricarboxylate transporter receptor subunit TctC